MPPKRHTARAATLIKGVPVEARRGPAKMKAVAVVVAKPAALKIAKKKTGGRHKTAKAAVLMEAIPVEAKRGSAKMEAVVVEAPKRGRGRPPKMLAAKKKVPGKRAAVLMEAIPVEAKRGRGRPPATPKVTTLPVVEVRGAPPPVPPRADDGPLFSEEPLDEKELERAAASLAATLSAARAAGEIPAADADDASDVSYASVDRMIADMPIRMSEAPPAPDVDPSLTWDPPSIPTSLPAEASEGTGMLGMAAGTSAGLDMVPPIKAGGKYDWEDDFDQAQAAAEMRKRRAAIADDERV